VLGFRYLGRMEYRVLVRKTEDGYDAWAPDRAGCASRGSTESEALRNLQHAIEGSLDLTEQMRAPEARAVEHKIQIETPEERHRRIELERATPPEPLLPISGWTQIATGGTLAAFGLVGIFFFFLVGGTISPVFLFAPFIVLALGIGGLVFGALTLPSRQ